MQTPIRAALALCALSSFALATDWYVDPVNGDDANFGTADMPYKTIRQAVAFAFDGDRIFCAPGLYAPSGNGEFFDQASGGFLPIVIGQSQGGQPMRLEIIGAGADQCTISPEGTQNQFWWCRMLFTAAGSKFSGFTFTNPTQLTARWECVWRLGSTTAGFTANDVTISNCVFDQCPRAFTSFGDSFNIFFHDNVVKNSDIGMGVTNINGTTLDLAFIYNNTFLNLNSAVEILVGGLSSVYLWNNNFVNVAVEGVWYDQGFSAPIVQSDWNNFWNCTANYGAGLGGGTNETSVDPLLVSGDHHLSTSSPLIDAGTLNPGSTLNLPATFTVYPPYGFDVDLNPRLMDGNYDGVTGIDVGAHEVNTLSVSGQGVYALGANVSLSVTDAGGQLAGPADPLFAFASAGAISPVEFRVDPLGLLYLDPITFSIITSGTMPVVGSANTGTFSFVMPSNPIFLGTRIPFQFVCAQVSTASPRIEISTVAEIGF